MPHFRFYIDKKIVKRGGVETGGDHSRIADVEAADEAAARKALAASAEKLKADEAENQAVEITPAGA